MKTLNDFLNICEFLGEEITEEQATRLMDEARHCLSISEIEILMTNTDGPLYSCLSEYNGEMGGLNRY